VQIRKNMHRALTANYAGVAKWNNATKVDYRNGANGNLAHCKVSMSDCAERRLRRIIPELEKKLNLNPKGQLIF